MLKQTLEERHAVKSALASKKHKAEIEIKKEEMVMKKEALEIKREGIASQERIIQIQADTQKSQIEMFGRLMERMLDARDTTGGTAGGAAGGSSNDLE